MGSLVLLAAVLIGALAIAALLFRPVAAVVWMCEQVLLAVSIAVILFIMAFVCAEVVMRYAFNRPIPGHLEGSELLMPIIVFFAVSYAQRQHAHVGMDLLIQSLPQRLRRTLAMITLLISAMVCLVLAYFSGSNALQLWAYDDVTATPPYFRTWPAAAAIPIGYGLMAMRMALQFLGIFAPERFPEDPADAAAAHSETN